MWSAIALRFVVFGAANSALTAPYKVSAKFETPLMIVANEGHLALVKRLIELGADPKRPVGYSLDRADFYARENGYGVVHEFFPKSRREKVQFEFGMEKSTEID